MAKKYMKRHSSSLIIGKNANQNHREISLTPVRTAIIKKKKRQDGKWGRGDGEKGASHTLGAVSARTAPVENTMEGPQKIKN